MRTTPCVLLVCAGFAAGCVRTGEPASPGAGAGHGTITLRVLDRRRTEVTRAAIPRRPQLWLAHPGGLPPDPETVVLLTGPADIALREDLASAPLRAEHLPRVVPCAYAVDPSSGDLVLAPLAA